MFNDAHLHIGQFYDIYTTPAELLRYMDDVKIERAAVSSTTICEENYNKVLREMSALIKLGNNRIVPVLWVTAAMLESEEFNRFLDSKICWKAIKIHRQTGWTLQFDEQIAPCLRVAKKLNIPIIFHTGDDSNCNAGRFETIIRQHIDQQFILAHSKPIGEVQEMMLNYPNILCDTSFQTAENIASLVNIGLEDRILWGSDYPIPKYYYREADMMSYYAQEWHKLKRRMKDSCFNRISFSNFLTVWQ